MLSQVFIVHNFYGYENMSSCVRSAVTGRHVLGFYYFINVGYGKQKLSHEYDFKETYKRIPYSMQTISNNKNLPVSRSLKCTYGTLWCNNVFLKLLYYSVGQSYRPVIVTTLHTETTWRVVATINIHKL